MVLAFFMKLYDILGQQFTCHNLTVIIILLNYMYNGPSKAIPSHYSFVYCKIWLIIIYYLWKYLGHILNHILHFYRKWGSYANFLGGRTLSIDPMTLSNYVEEYEQMWKWMVEFRSKFQGHGIEIDRVYSIRVAKSMIFFNILRVIAPWVMSSWAIVFFALRKHLLLEVYILWQ